ncbi:MAG: imidazole glycerol phosphate synthase subunit HisH [Ignavibacteria bacterium]|nr:MAG: imidazole glycerol phosphate synthase subunit HisH [Ignavibacteria bacterium]
MITIIDYGNTNINEVSVSLKELSADFITSNKETDILNADKLILPDCEDILSSIKKLHLLNLFSLLRIIKKPILGIGTGMHLMTKSFKDINAACLGCFPVECATKKIQQDMVVRELSIKIIKETKLLKNIGEDDIFYFAGNCFIPVTEFTTSITKITEEVSVSLEKNYMFGVQFNPEKSGEAGMRVLRNFVGM